MKESASTRIVILGARGDALNIAETVRQLSVADKTIALEGFLDDSLAGTKVGQFPVLGRLDDWAKLERNILFIPAIQKVRDMVRRASRIDSLEIPNQRWGTIIHPSAVIASNVQLGTGVYIAACAT